MKVSLTQMLLMTLLTSLVYSAELRGQGVLERKITLHLDGKEIKSILARIEKQISVRFTYNPNAIDAEKRISIQVNERELWQVLEGIFGSDISYELIGSEIVLKEAVRPESEPPIADVQNVLQVSGKVTNQSAEPIPGVNVIEKGTVNGTATDAEGVFKINVPDGNAVLVFSSIGYVSQEVSVNGSTVIDVVLKEDVRNLGEVVVIGYGAVEKRDLTGSVSSISAEEIQSLPVSRLDQALQGRAPGVEVMQTDGTPGGSVRVRIRGGNSLQGSNDPLYVIDGFAGGSIRTLNPSDIESMEILKDASATAIYGARGANGVVLITTKRGKAGKPRIDFDAYYSVQKLRKKLDLLNARQYAELINEARTNDGESPLIADPQSYGEGTDWQDEIYQVAPMQNYNLSFSGGNENVRYAISGNHFTQEGIVIGSQFERNSLRINLDADLSNKFKIGNSLVLSQTVDNTVPVNGSAFIAAASITSSAQRFSPTEPVYDDNGMFSENLAITNPIPNPVSLAIGPIRKNTVSTALANLFAEYTLIDGLVLRVSAGGNFRYGANRFYNPRTTYIGAGAGGAASLDNSESFMWQNENTITYDKVFNNKHSLNVLIGFTQQASNFEGHGVDVQGFANDVLTYKAIGAASTITDATSSAGKWALNSYIGRINYIFSDKYLFTFTARADGSSRFGEGNKWGYFPSAAFAWRLSEENFIQDLGFLSDLKLRTSYGLTGNQEIGSYNSLARLRPGNRGNATYYFGETVVTGFYQDRIANPNLKWETTAQYNVGLDIGIFQNRLTATANAYYKKTTDLLYNVQLPKHTGFSSSLQNIGSLENAGLELAINSVNVEGDFTWESMLNVSMNRSKLLDLGSVREFFTGGSNSALTDGNVGLLRIGEPIGLFYNYVTDGIFQIGDDIAGSAQPDAQPGDVRYVDIAGPEDENGNLTAPDGQITPVDKAITGNAQPDFIFGIGNNFSFKGFDLSIFINGVYGADLMNINRMWLESLDGISGNNLTSVLDRWTPKNPSNTMPRATRSSIMRISDRFIEDGSYLRVKNIALGYNIPSHVLKSLKMQRARVYVSAQNLLTFTNYSGYDPEVNSRGTSNLSLGIDFGSFPRAKTFTAGLNIGF